MCGIVGFSGKQDTDLLKEMNRLITHRGPDDDGFAELENMNLAMRRLSIIDLKTGHQPICSEDKSVWIVYNGEIYDYKKLRGELISFGHKFRTACDTEVIIHAYEQWGDDFIHRLNGMFAFAIWDIPKKTLLLYRDRLGIKPLFYSCCGGRLLFASEIRPLLANPDYKKEINFESLHHYFSCKNVPAPSTIFEGIQSLLPGERLVYKNGQIKKNFYWQIKYSENNNISQEEYQEKLFALLDDAVKIRMVADVPVGAYLSGGVDSSSVVALMRRHSSGLLKTFSLGYDDQFHNKEADLYFARKVAKQYQSDHHEYIMSAKEIPDDIREILSSFSEPFAGVISTFYLSKLIRKHVKVALSGDGADEMFGSYLSHRLAVPVHNFISNKMTDRKLSDEDLSLLGHFRDNIDFLRKIAHKDTWVWRSRLAVFNEGEKKEIFSDKLLSYTDKYSTPYLYKKYFSSSTTTDPLNKILENEIKMLLPDQVLAFVDRLSMAHSIEVRPPFLDYRIAELSAQIPGYMKIKNNDVKHILKQTVKGILPDGIINRPKEGFVLPVNQWIMGTLHKFIKDTLSADRLAKHGFFRYNAVDNLLKSHFNHTADNAAKLWTLVCFQIWYETYFN
ncbi:asparagine synthase (glutamine-hydrolyzing) [bacterium]|nr:asparagine synthase (glutamine-hydrolyzing) [bacterium]